MFTNIWKIWIPTLKRVIAMRDITFDTTRRYKPEDDRLDITDEEATALEEPQIQIELELDYELVLDLPRGVSARYEQSIDKPGDTIVVDLPSHTPEATPEPTNQPSNEATSQSEAEPSTHSEPRTREYVDLKGPAPRDISGDISQENIVPGKRVRKRALFTA